MNNKNDLASIEKLIKEQFNEDGAKSINKLVKGMTNRSYHVELRAGHFVFRLPGFGTEELINREHEYISNKIACELDIDSRLIYFDIKTGLKISEYISNPITMSPELLKKDEHIVMVADIYKKLHTSGIDSGVSFNVLDKINEYENYIRKNNIGFFDDYEINKAQIYGVNEQLHRNNISKTPCHNDALCENWIYGGEGRMYLIDWEYAGMNDPMWDVSVVSIEAGMNPLEDKKLLLAYLGCEPSTYDMFRFLTNKVLLDFLWSLWGKSRIPVDGLKMDEYAYVRYKRMLGNLKILENSK